jgi:hypothetical protein
MEDLESWLKNVIKQKENDEISWFLQRPSLRQAREKELTELA